MEKPRIVLKWDRIGSRWHQSLLLGKCPHLSILPDQKRCEMCGMTDEEIQKEKEASDS